MEYQGKPFKDSVYAGGPQSIPGRVMCAYYDFGGEGVAYHETVDFNQGSGRYNPADGTYLNEFRMDEAVDTTYVKGNGIDDNPYNLVQPELGIPYVGWTEPGEWIKYTVSVARTAKYAVSLLYTSNAGGEVSISVDDVDATGPLAITSTFNADDDQGFRQWHHWNVMSKMATIELEEGTHVLTLHTVSVGAMNYAYLDFELVG
jgi:hypothetical protein